MTATDPDARATTAYFDRIAAVYGSMYDQATPVGYAFSIRRERVLELLDAPYRRVLDVGCGPGVLAGALTDDGCSFWGIDPAEGMVQEAKKAHSSAFAQFCVASAIALPFPDEFFDAVTCMGVLERIADDEAALAEMARVLEPGGTLIVTVPNRMSPALAWRDSVFYGLIALARPLYRRLMRAKPQEVIRGHRRYGRRAFTARLARHGCDVVDVEYCGYPLLWAPFDALFPRLARWLMQRAERLHRGPLRSTGGAIVVKSEKRGRVR